MRHLLLALLVAACGKDAHHTVDAPPTDVAVDMLGASDDNPPANAVKLTVTRGTSPVENVAVYFQDPQSALIEQKLTSKNGLAWALMPDGGFVTAIEHVSAELDELTTFAAVQPADDLQLAFADPGERTLWPFEITFPAETGATGYTVYTSCSDSYSFAQAAPTTPPKNEMLLSGCDDGIADFIVVPLGGEGTPLGTALYAKDVTLPAPPAPQPTDAMPPALNTLALTGTYAAFETHDLSYTDVPDSVGFLGIFQAVSATRRTYETTTAAERTSPSLAAQLQLPAGAATQLTVTTTFPAQSTEKGQQLVYDWGAASTTYALDVDGALLPPYDSSPSFDVATRTISWTERAGAGTPNAVRARMHIHRDDIPTGRAWGWRIAAPRGDTTIVLPQLPVVDFDFNPKDGDSVGIGELTTVQLPGGYDAWRPGAFADLSGAVAGTSGRMVVQTLYFEPL